MQPACFGAVRFVCSRKNWVAKVTTIDSRNNNADYSMSESWADSAIVRQMVGALDAMSTDESESASALRDIAECLQLFSQARLWQSGSTNANCRDRTPDDVDESSEVGEPIANDRFEIRRLLGHGGFGVVL